MGLFGKIFGGDNDPSPGYGGSNTDKSGTSDRGSAGGKSSGGKSGSGSSGGSDKGAGWGKPDNAGY